MKKYIVMVCAAILMGCSCPGPKVVSVEVPIYTSPTFDMPIRPILKSDLPASGVYDTKPQEEDLLKLESYSIELENLLNSIKTPNTK